MIDGKTVLCYECSHQSYFPASFCRKMALMMTFKNLLAPLQIGRMQIRNRIVMSAMETGYGTEAGNGSQQTKDYYEERAMGGVGELVTDSKNLWRKRGRR